MSSPQENTEPSSEPVIPESSPEKSRSLPEISALRYFHIDDDPRQHETRQKQLAEKLHIPPEQRLGTAQSVPEAIRKIRELAIAGNAPRVIFLDQNFFCREGDEVPDASSSRRFVREYTKLTNNSEYGSALRDTNIVVVSGSDDYEYLHELQYICPAVVGRAPKGDDTEACIAVVLADGGFVRVDEIVMQSRRGILASRFRVWLLELESIDQRDLITFGTNSYAAILLCGVLADLRREAGLEPLDMSDARFMNIVEKIVASNKGREELEYGVPESLLLA